MQHLCRYKASDALSFVLVVFKGSSSTAAAITSKEARIKLQNYQE
jgi:hypothetical protein